MHFDSAEEKQIKKTQSNQTFLDCVVIDDVLSSPQGDQETREGTHLCTVILTVSKGTRYNLFQVHGKLHLTCRKSLGGKKSLLVHICLIF